MCFHFGKVIATGDSPVEKRQEFITTNEVLETRGTGEVSLTHKKRKAYSSLYAYLAFLPSESLRRRQ